MKPRAWPDLVALLLTGAALDAWLILRWPIIFGGDTILRMANREHFLLSYQLPALQAGLHYLARISESATLARAFMAAIGNVAAVGFYLLARHLMDRRSALLAALLFLSNPFLLALSTVPYQEILMLAALFFSFHFYLSGRLPLAGLSLGIACLTRYEAWAACPVLMLALARERRWKIRGLLEAVALFGWAPLIWIAYRAGLAPAGTYVLDTAISPRRLLRYVYLGWITVKYTPIPVLLLAIPGVLWIWKERAWKRASVALPALFLALFLMAILFSAHGESPDPERFVTAREAHLLISAVILVAGLGLAAAGRCGIALWILGFAWGVYGAARLVERETSAPNVQLSYDLARYLDRTLQGQERVLILARPIPPALIQAYLDKVFRTGGAAALADARRVLLSMDTSPPDYQRTLVHSHLGKKRILSFGGIAASEWKESEWPDTRFEWIAEWSDFAPANRLEARMHALAVRAGAPAQILRRGSLSVWIYRTAALPPPGGDQEGGKLPRGLK